MLLIVELPEVEVSYGIGFLHVHWKKMDRHTMAGLGDVREDCESGV